MIEPLSAAEIAEIRAFPEPGRFDYVGKYRWRESRRLLATIDARDEQLRMLAEAAEERLDAGHNDTCDKMKLPRTGYCNCGHAKLREAVESVGVRRTP